MRSTRWTQIHGSCRIIQGSQMQKNLVEAKQAPGFSSLVATDKLFLFDSWNQFPFTVKNKLREAIDLAPLMVREAIRALRQHVAAHESAGAQRADAAATETGLALLKYFHLSAPAADGAPPAASVLARQQYVRYVRGIIEVYDRINVGMSTNFEVVIEHLPTSAGQVSNVGSHPGPVSPIRAIFGFADEYGHLPWTTHTGDPHRVKIGSRYLCDKDTRPEDLARTLIHEASHKFARTKDILYKHNSFAKRDREEKASLAAQTPNAQMLVQRMARPGKPLAPMTGFADRASGTLIADERYLENADSYAWMARRLWKRSVRPAT